MNLLKFHKRFFSTKIASIPGIILFGVPGAGKGTFGSLIQKDWNYKKLTPGDLIRKMLTSPDSKSDPNYQNLKNCIDKGLLVDDNTVMSLIIDEFNKDQSKGVIFDGIPRNVNQVDLLKLVFDLKDYLLVNIELNEDILIEKLMGRRVCASCGKNYNLCTIDKDGYKMKPLLPNKEGVCDSCEGNLVRRADDTEEIIRNRIAVYYKETLPVIDRLLNSGVKRLDFVPKRGVEDYPRLKQEIQKHVHL